MEDYDNTAAAGGEEIKFCNDNKVILDRTLVLIGNTSSIEFGSKNILFDHNRPINVRKFSSKLYDLCGQYIRVINLLGLQNIEKIPLIQGIHAFLLLLPNGLHSSHYSSGVQWLENTFGRGALSYLITVVTHESGETCESALKELKANAGFDEKRYHKCTISMMDEKEIADLLEKINVMVSENDPQTYSGEHKQQKGHPEKSKKDEQKRMDSLGHTIKEAKENETASVISQKPVKVSEALSSMLRRLHIQDKFQQKLSTTDFVQIHPPVKQHHVTSEKDLPHFYLKMLMMLDYRARYIPVKSDTPEGTHPKPKPLFDRPDNDDSYAKIFFNSNVDTHQTEQTHMHPMDVQMAVFHCSDPFLKQIMITKLSHCQYALPLLVPNPVTMKIECPLWTFRKITKTWKVTQTKEDSNNVIMKSTPICKAQTHLVSFFRLGSLTVSKSQLMSTVINNRHSTFFHRDCPGSTKSRHLMDGVAEIAWYFPVGKPNDAFSDSIAFCNLHGDALLTKKQRDILIEQSSVNVFLIPTLEENSKGWSLLSPLLKSEKPLICLVNDDSGEFFDSKKRNYKMSLKKRSHSDVSEQLKKIIREVLFSDKSSLKPSFKLETMAKIPEITVDENDQACQKGKSAALKIVDLLTKGNKNVSKIKEEFLPCQAHLWHDWSKIHKELYHLRGDIEKEKSKKQQELLNIRKKQCASSCNELMKLFIGSLSTLLPPTKEYFLKWTQVLMDALSTDNISSILQSYEKKWSEVLDLKNKRDKSGILSRKQTELEDISKTLQSATFGLEHLFREMGQIYEARRTIEGQRSHADWSKYPELAAQLMISGHPMELMDGDAGHVPLTWVSSLLEEVIKKLAEQKIFVLSVLGLQSSGKSTMLNAMFGLQFAVSAGRCTKGAFMQLLKVSEEMKKDFKFDYVLVVDTEGLRALELEGSTTQNHDNKLATFVVGLGNLTLINIFGENPADMQDILQIVVQAFMRMKKVQLSPSCVLVHQNVTDVAADDRIMDGKRLLQEKLDQMAKLAAEEEVCNAECFSDVIEFDVQKDVKYCAQLWEGSPPMAPPNPAYSESLQELKNTILSKASKSDGVTLLQFKTKIEDLWNALLNENFVFSFKNTLEIAVYRKLEVQYGNWTWNLRSNMLTIENQLHNTIENENLDKLEVKYLFEKTSKTYEEITKDMKAYFDDDKEKDILVQWQQRFEIKIKEFYDEQVNTVKRKLDKVIQQKKACKRLDDKKSEFEKNLLHKSKELAQQLKDKAKDEKELEKHFSSVWSSWVTELTGETKPFEDPNLKADQFTILHTLGFEAKLIDECKNSGRYREMPQVSDYSDYVKKSGQRFVRQLVDVIRRSQSFLTPQEQQEIRFLINEVTAESLDEIRRKPVAKRGYTPTYLHEVANHVKEEVKKFQSECKFAFKKEFTVDLLLHVFDSSENWLLESQQKFKINNDPLIYLKRKKPHYYTIFRSYCKENASAVVLGELLCEKLKASTLEAVCNMTAIDLAGKMKCNFPAFSGNRLDLEKHLLKSLAEKQVFDDFIRYIQNPRRQTEIFIKAEVDKYIFKDHIDEARSILKENVEDIKSLVFEALSVATEKVQTQKGDTGRWLKEFSNVLGDKLTFDAICCQTFSDILDLNFLKDEIKKGFTPIITHINSISLNKLMEYRLKPDEILIEHLCKCCWVKCPFCSAVCTSTIENHTPEDHSVPFHRPDGVQGWHYSNTEELSIDFCTTNVASEGTFFPCHDSEARIAYKLYRTAGPKYANWRITPDQSKLAYWKWFISQFKAQLEKYYNLKFVGRGEIPRDWNKIGKPEAIESLDEMCQ